MRFVTGIIVGMILTVGVAYVTDSMHTAPGPDAPRMVNWGVVSDNLKGLSIDVQAGWDHLVGSAKSIDHKTGI